MDNKYKEDLLNRAKNHLDSTIKEVTASLAETKQRIEEIKLKLFSLKVDARAVQNNIVLKSEERVEQLDHLKGSPYFVKCEVKFDGETESRIFYFSKFSLLKSGIYSWTAPAAQLRFEAPGKFNYKVPEVGNKEGELLSKEQYMITDGKIVFMAAESTSFNRELIYQEYFSQQKTSFALPEIVEQMEKSQDLVIRAHPEGSFLVSGPAGSGKTTLALHRVAYLIQSPDSDGKFTDQNTIIFVQDTSTQEYFNQLLPQLGIHNVVITTFIDWVRKHLLIDRVKFINRYGSSEFESDRYEFSKYKAIQSAGKIQQNDDVYTTLNSVYSKYFSEDLLWVFEQQRKDRVLDRFDYTLLMMAHQQNGGGIFTEEIEYKQLKEGKVERKKKMVPLKYNLMVLDEVQNYLPEQIHILHGCLNQEINAMVYVGDLAQQTQLCTLRDWDLVGEEFAEDRKVILQKNYRSTKEIMEYIKQIGFNVEVPSSLREGSKVKEVTVATFEDEIENIDRIISDNSEVTIGVLAKTETYLKAFKEKFGNNAKVHVLTINEAQGVEFDVVCLVGINSESFGTERDYEDSLKVERARVDRDLLYVALTRAMNKLYVFKTNQISLSEIFK